MPILKSIKPKYKFEEDNTYKTISSDLSRDGYDRTFNKSIEEKRKLLGIPIYKHEFNNNNKNNLDEKKNINNLTLSIKREEEALINNKKNSLTQNNRYFIKNRNKTPIRITYKYNKSNINLNMIIYYIIIKKIQKIQK